MPKKDTDLCLLFDAIKDQARMLDERCTDPALTSFILAIDALAQRGFDVATRRPSKRNHASSGQ